MVSPSLSGSYTLPFLLGAQPEKATEKCRGYVPVAPIYTDQFDEEVYKKCQVSSLPLTQIEWCQNARTDQWIFKRGENKNKYLQLYTVADPEGTRVFLSVQFLLFSCSFQQKCGRIIAGRPPLRLAPPSGNSCWIRHWYTRILFSAFSRETRVLNQRLLIPLVAQNLSDNYLKLVIPELKLSRI